MNDKQTFFYRRVTVHRLQRTNMKEALVTELLIENSGLEPLN